MRNPITALVLLGLLAGLFFKIPAEEKPSAPIPVANKQDLSETVGREVAVEGKVSDTGKSASGHVFLNFSANSQFTIFVDSKVVAKFPSDPAKTYAGKKVVVRGKVEKYRDKLQIRLDSPDQIQLVQDKPAADGKPPGRPEPVVLKSLGQEDWISPAGVRYVGRDPEGLSRKDHVLRHARDIPNRRGPHGVFDGGAELTFAWIDEAWKKVQANKIKPETENGRDVYTVPMGRRVGYLGGQTGKGRNHPPLDTIFLVVRQGTSEVITAFPR